MEIEHQQLLFEEKKKIFVIYSSNRIGATDWISQMTFWKNSIVLIDY